MAMESPVATAGTRIGGWLRRNTGYRSFLCCCMGFEAKVGEVTITLSDVMLVAAAISVRLIDGREL